MDRSTFLPLQHTATLISSVDWGLAGLVNLRHLDFSGNSISDVSPLGGSAHIAYLYIAGNSISDVAPLAGLTQLRNLHISDNSISDVDPFAALPNLEELFLGINSIADLSPLVANTGLGPGDRIDVERNPLSDQSVTQHIPALRARGVDVLGASTPTAAAQPAPTASPPEPPQRPVPPTPAGTRTTSEADPYGLGLQVIDIPPEIRDEWELPPDVVGVFAAVVDPTGPAYELGTREHDIITGLYNGSGRLTRVGNPTQFHNLLAESLDWENGARIALVRRLQDGLVTELPSGVLLPDFLGSSTETVQPTPTAASQPAPTVQPQPGTIISADLIGTLPDDLLLLGSAFHAPGEGVVLTPPSVEQHGWLFYKHAINITEFEAEFSFVIGQGTGADGLAFVVSSTLPTGRPVPNNVIGLSSGDQLIGFAVEFDTYRNVDTNLNMAQDATGNHVDLTLYPEVTSLAETSNVPKLRNAGVFRASIRFDRGRVRVYLENDRNGMERTLVLDHYVPEFEPFEGYFGFYSATGALYDLHLIKDFELRISEDVLTGVPSSNHKRVGSGDAHTCALRSDGTAGCWGNNDYNQASPPGGAFVHISSGDNHSCALLQSGTIQCWGRNDHSQASPPAEEQFLTFDSSKWHNCGIRVDGTLHCWGSDIAGESSPPDGAFVAVSGGEWHTCGLPASGLPVCWGRNDHGQSSPPPGERFSSISSGFGNSCGIRFDGTAVCWGLNDVEQSDPPTGDQFLALAAGHGHTCGLRVDGTVACWGNDKWGKLDSPTGTFTSIDSSPGHTCALTDSLDLECWGPGASRDTSLRSDAS